MDIKPNIGQNCELCNEFQFTQLLRKLIIYNKKHFDEDFIICIDCLNSVGLSPIPKRYKPKDKDDVEIVVTLLD